MVVAETLKRDFLNDYWVEDKWRQVLMATWITNIYLWMGLAFLFLLLFIILFIFIIIISKKTHAVAELKSWMKGYPIALFL